VGDEIASRPNERRHAAQSKARVLLIDEQQATIGRIEGPRGAEGAGLQVVDVPLYEQDTV